MLTREEMISHRQRKLPIKWFDLVTFDKQWLRNKIVLFYDDTDGVRKPLVLDPNGNQVYPTK